MPVLLEVDDALIVERITGRRTDRDQADLSPNLQSTSTEIQTVWFSEVTTRQRRVRLVWRNITKILRPLFRSMNRGVF